jgi:hypothetical protein
MLRAKTCALPYGGFKDRLYLCYVDIAVHITEERNTVIKNRRERRRELALTCRLISHPNERPRRSAQSMTQIANSAPNSFALAEKYSRRAA